MDDLISRKMLLKEEATIKGYSSLKFVLVDDIKNCPSAFKGMTNGEVMLAIFGEPAERTRDGVLYKFAYRGSNGEPLLSTYFSMKWWNTLYRKGENK